MKKYLLLLAICLLAGCSKPAEKTTAVGVNNEFEVEEIFTHQGCTVFRFVDGGYTHYYTNCGCLVSHIESCGKNCNKQVE